MFGVAIVAAIVLNKSIFGRYVFALGSNEEAASLSGVNVDFWKLVTYAVGGLICGVAGLLISSRLNSAQPALGPGYELDAIAAVVIGGTSLSGGRGSIMGTIIHRHSSGANIGIRGLPRDARVLPRASSELVAAAPK